MKIVKLESSNHQETVIDYISNEWGLPVVTRGKIIDIKNLPGFVVLHDDKPAGAIIYQIVNYECEIAVLFSLMMNAGSGTALIKAVIDIAQVNKCKRVWLITTNDNTPAIRFYQKRGFNMKALHVNAFKETQRIKNEGDGTIYGNDNIPILHEIEFEIQL